MLGIAFSFKLQTVFIIPFFLTYYSVKKDHSIFLYLWTVLVLELSGIPSYLMGRDISAPFQIYFFQVGEYKDMWMNTWSFWQFAGDNYGLYSKIAIILTAVLLGVMMYTYKKKKNGGLKNMEEMLAAAVWMSWTCVVFLPAMHERYAFLTDLMLLALVFVNKKYLYFVVAAILGSIIRYGAFFSDVEINSLELNALYMAFYFVYTGNMIKKYFREEMNDEKLG